MLRVAYFTLFFSLFMKHVIQIWQIQVGFWPNDFAFSIRVGGISAVKHQQSLSRLWALH
jgi:hypothetical protein